MKIQFEMIIEFFIDTLISISLFLSEYCTYVIKIESKDNSPVWTELHWLR